MECRNKIIRTGLRTSYTEIVSLFTGNGWKEKLSVVLAFFIIINSLQAQTSPKEGSALNYRLIDFSFQHNKKDKDCKLEIANGNYSAEDLFKKNILKTEACEGGRIIAEVPFWGNQYTWRLKYKDSTGANAKSELHHFSTSTTGMLDTNMFRLRIISQSTKYKDAFVLLDRTRMMYDMNGRPVWFLPESKAWEGDLRDLKLSPFGTITFLCGDKIFEANYDGDILWKGPDNGKVSGDNSEHYHHEFTRLTNGHYMVMGDEEVGWTPELAKLKGCRPLGVSSDTMKGDITTSQKSMFGTLIEYDEKGKIVWSWRSSCYFIKSDLMLDDSLKPGINDYIDIHSNSFYFDEKHKTIYIGFRGLSRIVKIRYPDGAVLNTYGEIYKASTPKMGNGLFLAQHSISLCHNGELCVYNNNFNPAKPFGQFPKVVLMQQPGPGKGQLKKSWEYECTVPEGGQRNFTTGGDVEELSDSSLFVCMGGSYSKISIINRARETLWSALPETYIESLNRWGANQTYRAHLIENRKDLEKLIWATEKK